MLYLIFGETFFASNYVAEIHLFLWPASAHSF